MENSIFDKDKHFFIHLYQMEGHQMFEDLELNANRKDINTLHKLALKYNIPENRIIFINGDMNLEENYKIWFTNSKYKNPINVLGYPYFFYEQQTDVMDDFSKKKPSNLIFERADYFGAGYIDKEYERIKPLGPSFFRYKPYSLRNNLPSKRFISLNGMRKFNRSFLIREYTKRNLKQYGYISDLSREISVDGRGKNYMSYPSIDKLKPFYNDVYFDVISEGLIDEYNVNIYNFLHITEKTWRPIYQGVPFILCGNHGSLKQLRHWGFETFPEIFDESYDNIVDWTLKCEFIIKEIERVCNMSDEEILKLFTSVSDKIVHNQEHFFYTDRLWREFLDKFNQILLNNE
jgi:hypothetical protein